MDDWVQNFTSDSCKFCGIFHGLLLFCKSAWQLCRSTAAIALAVKTIVVQFSPLQVLAPVTVAPGAGSAGAVSVGQTHSSSVQSGHASSQSPSVNHSNSTSPSLHQQLAQAVHSTVSNASTTLVSPTSLTATARPANSHPVTVVSTAEGLSAGVGQLLPSKCLLGSQSISTVSTSDGLPPCISQLLPREYGYYVIVHPLLLHPNLSHLIL